MDKVHKKLSYMKAKETGMFYEETTTVNSRRRHLTTQLKYTYGWVWEKINEVHMQERHSKASVCTKYRPHTKGMMSSKHDAKMYSG